MEMEMTKTPYKWKRMKENNACLNSKSKRASRRWPRPTNTQKKKIIKMMIVLSKLNGISQNQ